MLFCTVFGCTLFILIEKIIAKSKEMDILSAFLKQDEINRLPVDVAQKCENHMKQLQKMIEEKHVVNQKLVQTVRKQAIKIEKYTKIKEELFDFVDKMRAMDLEEKSAPRAKPAFQSMMNISNAKLDSNYERQTKYQDRLDYHHPSCYFHKMDAWNPIQPALESRRKIMPVSNMINII